MGMRIADQTQRQCTHCGGCTTILYTDIGKEPGTWLQPVTVPDSCLGMIPGVEDACCGHGARTIGPYVALAGFSAIRSAEANYLIDARATGLWLDSMAALNWFADHGVGPLVVPCEPYTGPCPTDPTEATAYLNTQLVAMWSAETWSDENARLEAIARHSMPIV